MAAGMCHHHRIFRKCGIQYKTVGMPSLFQIIVVISRSDNPVAGFQLFSSLNRLSIPIIPSKLSASCSMAKDNTRATAVMWLWESIKQGASLLPLSPFNIGVS